MNSRAFRIALAFVCLVVSLPVFGSKAVITRCEKILGRPLTTSQSFALAVAESLAKDGAILDRKKATRILREIDPDSESELLPKQQLEAVLKDMGLSVEDWEILEGMKHQGAILGSTAFTEGIAVLSAKKPACREPLVRLNLFVSEAQKKLRGLIAASELLHYLDTKSLRDQAEILEIAAGLVGRPKVTLVALGATEFSGWRQRMLLENEDFLKTVRALLDKTLLVAVTTANEIPQSEAELIALVAKRLAVAENHIADLVGPGLAFANVNAWIDFSREKHPKQFVRVIDRRIFNDARRDAMLKAIREANDVVMFTLAENQDVLNFDEVKLIAQELGAPILVSPAFSEIGLIPTKMKWLFEEPNVHFLVDRGIQITRDFYAVDFGYEDKRQFPFVGMAEIFQPTDKVILFHPKVRAVTRATANFDTRPGYFVSTGTMSDPAYWGKFQISMSTDIRAQQEAEQNRGVVVLSRRYRSAKYGNLFGSANGLAPRRVRFAEPMYGNPAGLFDLGKLYTAKGVLELPSIPAIVLGDIHLGATDPAFLKGVLDALVKLKILEKNPEFGKPFELEYRAGKVHLGAIVLHDLIDGLPNNGHIFDQLITKAIADKEGALDLTSHVQSAAAMVQQLAKLLPKTQIVVPVDNHGSDWLVKRLQRADFEGHGRPSELPTILKLMLAAIEKKNPYKTIFQNYGVDTDQVVFLNPTETYRVGIDLENPEAFRMTQGVEVGQHSHMGVNGAKWISLQRLLIAYGANVTGHTHSSGEHGTAVKVGTGTAAKQSFYRGPANSDQSIALVYSNLAIQLLRMERGTFIPNAPDQKPEEFFPGPEYPRLLKHKMPPGGPTTDQYRSDPPSGRGALR